MSSKPGAQRGTCQCPGSCGEAAPRDGEGQRGGGGGHPGPARADLTAWPQAEPDSSAKWARKGRGQRQ